MANESPVGPPADPRGVNGLVLNLILPGLGSIYCGQGQVGAGQLALFGAGVLMLFYLFFIGLFMIAGAWIWAAIVGFQLMSSPPK
jgi:hypothetical protein